MDHRPDRPPPVHRAPRRPHLRRRQGPRDRGRHARDPDGLWPPLRPPGQKPGPVDGARFFERLWVVKTLLRSDAVQEFLGWLSWLYLELVIRTIRWTRIGAEPDGPLGQVLRGPGGMIGCFWHRDIALSITAKVAVIEHKLTRILISLSPAGEFIARSMVRHNLPPIRGSKAKKGKA